MSRSFTHATFTFLLLPTQTYLGLCHAFLVGQEIVTNSLESLRGRQTFSIHGFKRLPRRLGKLCFRYLYGRCLISNDSTLLKNRLQCVFIKSKCGKNGVLVMKLITHLTSSVIFNTEDEQNKKSICIIHLERKTGLVLLGIWFLSW